MQEIAATVIDMIARQKSIDPATVTPESTFDSLQMDSLDKINLSFEVEEKFSIDIPDESLNSLRTVSDVIEGIERLQAQSQAQSQAQPQSQA